MSMKSSFGLLAAMGLMLSSQGQVGSGRYVPKIHARRDVVPLSDELGIPTNIPKGHKTEPVTFEFEHHMHTLKINLTISYGTQKAKVKKITLLRNELGEYIRRTGIKNLKNFGQFEITEIMPITNEDLNGNVKVV